ncbi:MAG TPA: hypothetical protein VHS27_22175 [Gaiellales bacterium]|nr:hypothetical protein [Gaiellales bacterium]
MYQARRQQPHQDAAPPRGHVEDRTEDGSCKPYLAAAVILAAGPDCIEHGLDLAGDGAPVVAPVGGWWSSAAGAA